MEWPRTTPVEAQAPSKPPLPQAPPPPSVEDVSEMYKVNIFAMQRLSDHDHNKSFGPW